MWEIEYENSGPSKTTHLENLERDDIYFDDAKQMVRIERILDGGDCEIERTTWVPYNKVYYVQHEERDEK